MLDVTRSVDEIEQALADLLANSVEKGSGYEAMPHLRAYYTDVLDPDEQANMVEALRRWLTPEQYRQPAPDQPPSLWLMVVALAPDLRLVQLIPDIEGLARVAEQETPPPRGTYTAKTLRGAAHRLRTAR